jgi:hypothetical protein
MTTAPDKPTARSFGTGNCFTCGNKLLQSLSSTSNDSNVRVDGEAGWESTLAAATIKNVELIGMFG